MTTSQSVRILLATTVEYRLDDETFKVVVMNLAKKPVSRRIPPGRRDFQGGSEEPGEEASF